MLFTWWKPRKKSALTHPRCGLQIGDAVSRRECSFTSRSRCVPSLQEIIGEGRASAMGMNPKVPSDDHLSNAAGKPHSQIRKLCFAPRELTNCVHRLRSLHRSDRTRAFLTTLCIQIVQRICSNKLLIYIAQMSAKPMSAPLIQHYPFLLSFMRGADGKTTYQPTIHCGRFASWPMRHWQRWRACVHECTEPTPHVDDLESHPRSCCAQCCCRYSIACARNNETVAVQHVVSLAR
jgi:hypothetical protein